MATPEMSSIRHTLRALAASATMATMPLTASAQLEVLISGGFSGPYEQLLPQFTKATGIRVTTGSGSSQGSGPQTIRAQLTRGVAADVVILSREGLSKLTAAARILPGTDVDLAQTPLGVAVRAGAPKPAVRTVEDFKRLVTQARLVAVPSSTSGIFFRDEVLPRLGIADQVRMKAAPRGAGATAMVAAGEADVAVMPVSEIVHAPGVDLVGVIAEEIQLHQVFAAAIVADAKHVEAARRLIAFLSSADGHAAIRSGGMEPAKTRR
jgi:molybdate transport system substrate-binding protein